MRYRALALPLVVTGGDYVLWNWSLSSGHDILALIAGLTLLPLIAVSCGLVGLAVLSLVARIMRQSSRMARSMRASTTTPETIKHQQPQAAAERTSRDRLAA